MNIIYFFLVTHHYDKKTSRQRTGLCMHTEVELKRYKVTN